MKQKGLIVLVGIVIGGGLGIWLGRKDVLESFTDVPHVSSDQGEGGGIPTGQTRVFEKGSPSVPVVTVVLDGGNTVSAKEEEFYSENISEVVRPIVGEGFGYESRQKAIEALSSELSPGDVVALREFLWEISVGESSLSLQELNSLKNDVLDRLMEQSEFPAGLDQQIVDMFSDPKMDYMWREYCLQFMPTTYQKGTGNKVSVGSSSNKNMDPFIADAPNPIGNILWAALNMRDREMAGTALLGLDELSETHAEFDPNDIMHKAVEIASDSDASANSRLTALRLATARGATSVLPVARDLALNAETDLLRGAAITTLGDIGGVAEYVFLESLMASEKRQLAAAVAVARKKINERMNHQ